MPDGKREQALQQMRSAADHEDRTDKDNVMPGVILPARELLGQMLLDLKQPAQAMVEFEATLRMAPIVSTRWRVPLERPSFLEMARKQKVIVPNFWPSASMRIQIDLSFRKLARSWA